MDTTGVELEFPTSRDLSDRLDWASGKMWDFSEGTISRQQLALVGAMLYGWADLAAEDEKRQYRAIGKQVNDLVKNSEEDMQPNRALNRHQLETIAWQMTPERDRRGSGSRRAVLVDGKDGLSATPLSELTDNQIRRYIGPQALEAGDDMKKNSKAGASAEFKPTLTSGKRVDYLSGKRDNTLLVYVTKEPDGLYYVWTRHGLETKPDWTYGFRKQTDARQEMQRLGGYAGEPHRWEEGLEKNASRQEPDENAARELSLYIENEYSLVGAPNSRGKAIEKNLLQKIRNGTFDLARSEDAWMYLMEAGAKKYAKEYASPKDWSVMFNKATRELVAHEFATTFYEEHKATGGLSRNGSVDDGDYVVQGMYSDGTVCVEFGFDDEEKAVREAKKLLKVHGTTWFEGDRVRVMTRDGELVYSSKE